MGSLVLSNPLQPNGRLSDRDSYVMFHPTDSRAPHMLIARGELPSLFIDVSGYTQVPTLSPELLYIPTDSLTLGPHAVPCADPLTRAPIKAYMFLLCFY